MIVLTTCILPGYHQTISDVNLTYSTFSWFKHNDFQVVPENGFMRPGICVVMNAGDALWVPAGWHHQVSTLKKGKKIDLEGEEKGREEEEEDVDFVFSFNRFYPTSICKLTCWSRYVVGRLVVFNWIVDRCCRDNKKQEGR